MNKNERGWRGGGGGQTGGQFVRVSYKSFRGDKSDGFWGIYICNIKPSTIINITRRVMKRSVYVLQPSPWSPSRVYSFRAHNEMLPPLPPLPPIPLVQRPHLKSKSTRVGTLLYAVNMEGEIRGLEGMAPVTLGSSRSLKVEVEKKMVNENLCLFFPDIK